MISRYCNASFNEIDDNIIFYTIMSQLCTSLCGKVSRSSLATWIKFMQGMYFCISALKEFSSYKHIKFCFSSVLLENFQSLTKSWEILASSASLVVLSTAQGTMILPSTTVSHFPQTLCKALSLLQRGLDSRKFFRINNKIDLRFVLRRVSIS